MIITKSDYVNFFVCPRLFFLRKFHKELGAPLTDEVKERMENGRQVGILAQDYFGPNHVVVDREHLDLNQCVAKTKEYIDNGEHIICEASFMYKDLFCAVDVLKVNDDGSVEIYEVKSTSKIEKKHHADVSFQNYVLTKCGYNVKRSVILHINGDYIYHDNLDLQAYFAETDAKLKNDVEDRLNEMRKYDCTDPLVAVTPCKKCEFFKHCFSHLRTDGQSIFNIAGVQPAKLYNKGLRDFDDYLNTNPTGDVANNAKLQIDFTQHNKPRSINKQGIQDWINNNLTYPLYFLDFEAVNDTIPFINDTKPNFTRIMQFSLHIVDDIHEDKPRHEEYLQDDGRKNNLEEVADELITKLGTKGSILMYTDYEKKRIVHLAKLLPHKAKELSAIVGRLVDLSIPFEERLAYDRKQKGRYTIKFVLPAYCPEYENKYADLPLCHNGGQITYYYNLLCDQTNPDHEKIKNGLLEYCKLDTLAEVEVLKELYKMADLY